MMFCYGQSAKSKMTKYACEVPSIFWRLKAQQAKPETESPPEQTAAHWQTDTGTYTKRTLQDENVSY